MAGATQVTTAEELMRLIEESRILRAEELARAHRYANETQSSKMLARRLVARGILTRWQAGQLLVGWSKLRLGKHKLCGQIGRGSVGRVFLAEHVQLERQAAIKTLSRRHMQRPEIVERFLSDARDVAALDHRNILHVFDVDNDNDQYFLVMEYVKGRDLQRLVEEDGPLPFDVAADFVRQAAAGLSHAHELGLIHQDVRPSNLMVNESGTIKVLGLGVGSLSALGHRTDQESGKSNTGSADYLSPEQAKNVTPVDACSDIYALGCVLHFLLTGQPPFHRGTDRQRRRQHIEAQPTDIVELRGDTPPKLADILRSMMAKDPNDRFGAADTVANELRDWLENEDSSVLSVGQASAADSESGFNWTPQDADQRPKNKNEAVGDQIVGEDGSESTDAATRFPPVRRLILWAALALFLPAACVALFLWLSSSQGANDADENEVAMRQPLPDTPPDIRRKRREKKREPTDSDAAGTTLPKVGEKDPGAGTDDAAGTDSKRSKIPAKTPAKKGAGANPAGEAPKSKAKPGAGETAKKPEPKKPEPKTPTPKSPPPPDPFRNLPPAVDVADLDAASDEVLAKNPIDLGAVDPDETVSLSVALIGGDTAGPEGVRFALVPATAEEPRSWRCRLNDGETTITVAHVELEELQLRFRWDSAAAEHAASCYLVNCVLRFRSGSQSHDLRLRTSRDAKPFELNLKKVASSGRWKVPLPPDASQLRCQITSLGPPLPKAPKLTPETPVPLNGDPVWVTFGDESILVLEISPVVKGQFRLNCRIFFALDPKAEPELAVQKKIANAEVVLTRNRNNAFQALQRLRQSALQAKRKAPARKVREQDMKLAEAELTRIATLLQKVIALRELTTRATEGAPIGFRLFFLAGDCEVDLLQTPAPAAAPEAEDEEDQ